MRHGASEESDLIARKDVEDGGGRTREEIEDGEEWWEAVYEVLRRNTVEIVSMSHR